MEGGACNDTSPSKQQPRLSWLTFFSVSATRKEHFNIRNLVHLGLPWFDIEQHTFPVLVCNSMQFTERTTFSTQNKKSTSKTTAHTGLHRAPKTSAAPPFTGRRPRTQASTGIREEILEAVLVVFDR